MGHICICLHPSVCETLAVVSQAAVHGEGARCLVLPGAACGAASFHVRFVLLRIRLRCVRRRQLFPSCVFCGNAAWNQLPRFVAWKLKDIYITWRSTEPPKLNRKLRNSEMKNGKFLLHETEVFHVA